MTRGVRTRVCSNRPPFSTQGGASDLIDVRITRTAGSVLVVLAGELDLSAAPRVIGALHACLVGDGPRRPSVSVDLSGVTFCDCAGLGALMRTRDELAARGIAVRLVDPSPAVTRLLTLLLHVEALSADDIGADDRPGDPDGEQAASQP